MYLHGMSTGDFVPALEGFFGSAPGCRLGDHPADQAVAGRAGRVRCAGTCRAWTTCTCGSTASTSTSASKRNGSAAWSWSVSAPMAPRSWSPSPTATGSRPSSWADLLRDLRSRGMRAPVLAVGDGALGFWAALRDVWPETRSPAVLGAQGRQRPRRAAEVGAPDRHGGCWPRSATPRTATTPCAPRRVRSRVRRRSGPRRSPRSSTTSTRCSRSSTSRPSTGSTSRRPTRSSRRSRPCGSAPG